MKFKVTIYWGNLKKDFSMAITVLILTILAPSIMIICTFRYFTSSWLPAYISCTLVFIIIIHTIIVVAGTEMNNSAIALLKWYFNGINTMIDLLGSSISKIFGPYIKIER
jgi:hypothetical protein